MRMPGKGSGNKNPMRNPRVKLCPPPSSSAAHSASTRFQCDKHLPQPTNLRCSKPCNQLIAEPIKRRLVRSQTRTVLDYIRDYGRTRLIAEHRQHRWCIVSSALRTGHKGIAPSDAYVNVCGLGPGFSTESYDSTMCDLKFHSVA